MKRITIAVVSLLSMLALSPAIAADDNASSTTILSKTSNSCQEGITKARIMTIYSVNSVLSPFSIDVDVQNDTAKLSGTVQNGAQKDLAISIAQNMEGIATVNADNLKIDKKLRPGQTGTGIFQKIADATITAAVKTKLIAKPKISGTDITVTTVNNIVTLEGKVKNGKEKRLAGEAAIKTMGVSSVKNKLTIGND